MKYVRTKDDKIFAVNETISNVNIMYQKINGVKQSDTIKELCDEFVYHVKGGGKFIDDELANKFDAFESVYGAIWTEWGLKYVAKINDEGKLELL